MSFKGAKVNKTFTERIIISFYANMEGETKKTKCFKGINFDLIGMGL